MMDTSTLAKIVATLEARGIATPLAEEIASTLDIREEDKNGRWVIRDDAGKVIAVIDPL